MSLAPIQPSLDSDSYLDLARDDKRGRDTRATSGEAPLRITRTCFLASVAAAVLLGVVFRAEHVEHRLFWGDEAVTALHVSGRTYGEFRGIFDGRVHPLLRILDFQRVDPSRPLSATIADLAAEEPQHTPLFYAADRAWASVAGSSVAALRLPAMLFSLFAIAAVAWFCFELTSNAFTAGAAAALMALSPFFVDYGGQAREYSLWAMMLALTSALLLRALRGSTTVSWLWYGGAMALALYSDFLMIAVLAAHALYVAAFHRRNHPVLIAFGIAAAGALLVFIPWIAAAVRGSGAILVAESEARVAYPTLQFVEKWAFNAGAVLFDAEYGSMHLLPIAGAMLALLAYCAYRLFRDEAPRVAWFVAMPALAVTLPQILYDIATHGHESTRTRYLIPLWLALLVTVALFFGHRLRRSGGRAGIAWLSCLALVLAVAGWSSAINSSAIVWWDNPDDYPTTSMAARINQSSAPLVVSGGSWEAVAEVLVISHYVSPNTRFLLFEHSPPLPFRLAPDTFLLAPSPATLAAFRAYRGYSIVPVPVASLLSTALLGFRQTVLRSSYAASTHASFGGFLYRVVDVRRTAPSAPREAR